MGRDLDQATIGITYEAGVSGNARGRAPDGRSYPPQFQELERDRQAEDLASPLDRFGPQPPV